MKKSKYLKQKGVTLIEVLVTVSIFAVLVFGVSAMLSDIFTNQNQELLSLSNIDQARAVSSSFTNEIRNATTGSDGSYPLNQAGDNQIIFYSNFKVNNGTVNRIRYFVQDNSLYKGVVSPSGDPLTYNLLSESVALVQDDLSNGTAPLFYYYDGNYNGLTAALSQPINLNQVRFVKINLIVKNQTTANGTGAFSVDAGAAIRAVKDNLGN